MREFFGPKPGFTLIESLIYIACSTFLILLVSSFISNIYQNSIKNSQLVDRYFELVRAHDFIVTYLRSAPVEKSLWKKIEANNFAWTSLKSDYGFYIDSKNRLIKKSGSFDTKKQEWVSPGYSILANYVALELVLEADISGKFTGTTIKLKDLNSSLVISRFVKFYVNLKV